MVCVVLAGCGGSTGLPGKVLAGFSSTGTEVPVTVDTNAPMIDVSIASRGVSGGMARISQRGDVSEWRSADGIGLTLKGDQIIATRGLGADLLIATAQGSARALQQGGGTFSRTMHWLDGENHDRAEVFTCTLSRAESQPEPSERALTETCAGPQTRFTNTYSVAKGRVIRSAQWISAGLGTIEFERR
jgi:hypothetical protein